MANVAGPATVQASNRLLQGEPKRVEVERALGHACLSRSHLREHAFDVDSAVGRGEGRESPRRLLELPPRCDGTAAAGLVPGDRDVNEALEEVALSRLGGTPRVFQLLVSGEELAGANQFQAALERIVRSRP